MVHAPGKDALWVPPFRGVPGMASWVEAPGLTQDLLEGLYLQAGLGVTRDLPERAGECCWRQGGLGYRNPEMN